ncbi:hypothetical protein FB107DRAFT_280097 [Schizophyllum commune]
MAFFTHAMPTTAACTVSPTSSAHIATPSPSAHIADPSPSYRKPNVLSAYREPVALSGSRSSAARWDRRDKDGEMEEMGAAGRDGGRETAAMGERRRWGSARPCPARREVHVLIQPAGKCVFSSSPPGTRREVHASDGCRRRRTGAGAGGRVQAQEEAPKALEITEQEALEITEEALEITEEEVLEITEEEVTLLDPAPRALACSSRAVACSSRAVAALPYARRAQLPPRPMRTTPPSPDAHNVPIRVAMS